MRKRNVSEAWLSASGQQSTQSGFFLGSPAMDQLSSVGRGTQGQDEKSEEGYPNFALNNSRNAAFRKIKK